MGCPKWSSPSSTFLPLPPRPHATCLGHGWWLFVTLLSHYDFFKVSFWKSQCGSNQVATGAIVFYRPTHSQNHLQSVTGPSNTANNSCFKSVNFTLTKMFSVHTPQKHNKETLPILTQPKDHKIKVAKAVFFLVKISNPQQFVKVCHSTESALVYIRSELPLMGLIRMDVVVKNHPAIG